MLPLPSGRQRSRLRFYPLRTLRSAVRGKAMKPQPNKSETSQMLAELKEPDDGSRRRFLKASSIFSLAVAFTPNTIVEAFTKSKSGIDQEEDFVTQTSATQPQTDKTAIRPFQFNFPDAELSDLRRRINATRWPDPEQVTDASQGVQLATMRCRSEEHTS